MNTVKLKLFSVTAPIPSVSEREWPATFEYLASTIRSGMSIPHALAALAERGNDEIRSTFMSVRRDLAVGLPLEAATIHLKGSHHGNRLRETLLLAREIGVEHLPELLLISSRFIRREIEVKEEIKVRQGWVRNGARLGLFAPWAILLLLLTRASTRAAMFTLSGGTVVAIGAGACVIASWWMHRAAKIPGIS
jgi:tight adherence protein B